MVRSLRAGVAAAFAAALPQAWAWPEPVPVEPAAAPVTRWAVIVAGSNGYGNYRHQADACHAYQVVKAKGIPEDHIILMAYDDIANNDENPFKGKLFNKPDPKGPGKDVYAGCKIDYKGADVTPQNFLNVLTGKGSGKVLKSTAQDHVFVFFSDHGATGLIAFPSDELHKDDLQKAITEMHTAKKYKQLVFYLEACESGSMFQGYKVPGFYGLSASNPDESSWGTYCDSGTDVINGTELNTCLGDLFSVSWLEDSDAKDTTKETLETQFKTVQKLTTKSHVMQWGDLSFTSRPVSDFIGPKPGVTAEPIDGPVPDRSGSSVSTRQVDLQRTFQAYSRSTVSETRLVSAARMQAELARQQQVELVYLKLVQLVFPGDAARQGALRFAREEPDHPACEKAVHRTIREQCAARFDANSGFALQFHQIVVNLCGQVARGLEVDPVALARQACQAPETELVV